jgi:hypothetical protein
MLRIMILNFILLLHPVHVTIISLNKDQGTNAMKMMFRMYYDDFLLDYKFYKPDFKPSDVSEPEKYFQGGMDKYFNERVQIYVNKKQIKGTISEISINEYEILMSLAYEVDNPPKTLKIRNQILTKIYNDQANMIYLKIDGYEDAVKLTPDNTEATVKIK